MRRILFLLFIFIFFTSHTYAEESKTSANKIIEGEVIELEKIDDPEIFDETVETTPKKQEPVKTGISKYYSFDKGLFKIKINDYAKFDFGMIGDVNWNINNDDNQLHTNFYFPSTDIIFSGQANKYIDYKAQVLPHRNIDTQTILGDVWVRGKYKNYYMQLGRMRKTFTYEAAHSPYDWDFARASQINRLFGDLRDTGGKITAEYKYADIALGVFASMQNRPFEFREHGIEGDAWISFKPLANYPQYGHLRLSGGVEAGKRDYSYTNFAGEISYQYKNFGLRSEYVYKQPSFYNEKKADGFYVDGTYFLTDKLQAAVRFDSYNPDINNQSRRNQEYTAGLNYYLNNRNTMLILNYTLCDAATISHRIALQMRYKTW